MNLTASAAVDDPAAKTKPQTAAQHTSRNVPIAARRQRLQTSGVSCKGGASILRRTSPSVRVGDSLASSAWKTCWLPTMKPP